MIVGTPQYISPEQAMGKRGDEVDGRADLYSLGVVLYEMVTGRLPFQSDTAMGMLLHHLQTAPTPPSLARPDLDIPAPLTDVLMRALQKDRDQRFASAEEMLAALDGVAALPAARGSAAGVAGGARHDASARADAVRRARRRARSRRPSWPRSKRSPRRCCRPPPRRRRRC